MFLSSRIPDDWSRVGRVWPSEELQLTFALKQRGVAVLEDTLRRVSDPDSPQYGRTVCGRPGRSPSINDTLFHDGKHCVPLVVNARNEKCIIFW